MLKAVHGQQHKPGFGIQEPRSIPWSSVLKYSTPNIPAELQLISCGQISIPQFVNCLLLVTQAYKYISGLCFPGDRRLAEQTRRGKP